jgi:hypothetical protein
MAWIWTWLSSIDSPPASTWIPSVKGERMVWTRPPTRSRASRTVTSQPLARSASAAVSPDSPPPTTTTFCLVVASGLGVVEQAANTVAAAAVPAAPRN